MKRQSTEFAIQVAAADVVGKTISEIQAELGVSRHQVLTCRRRREYAGIREALVERMIADTAGVLSDGISGR